MRVAIAGTGAMGSLFAAHLSDVADVVMLGHWQAQIDAIRQHGLRLDRPNGRSTTTHFTAAHWSAPMPPFDLALVLVKSYQTTAVAHHLQPLLTRDGLAITLQNGLGNRDQITAVLGSTRTGLGTTAQGATLLAPGHVRHAGHGPTHLGATGHPRLPDLVALLNAAGLEAQLTPEVDSLIWGKLAVNAAINPLTALLDVPNGALAEDARTTAVMQAVAEEVTAVAQALSIDLPYPSAGVRALDVARATAANLSSMLQDVRRDSPTEIDAICGAVVAHGREHTIPVPLNQHLLRWVHAREQNQPIPPPATILQTLLTILQTQTPRQ